MLRLLNRIVLALLGGLASLNVALASQDPSYDAVDSIISGKISFESVFPDDDAKRKFLSLPQVISVTSKLSPEERRMVTQGLDNARVLGFLMSFSCFEANSTAVNTCLDKFIYQGRRSREIPREDFDWIFFHEYRLFSYARSQRLEHLLYRRYLDVIGLNIDSLIRSDRWEKLAYYQLLLTTIISEELDSYELSMRRGNLIKGYLIRQWQRPESDRDLGNLIFFLTGILEQDDYFDYGGLDEIFDYLFNSLISESEILQYSFLHSFLQKNHNNWPLKNKPKVYRQQLLNLVARCIGKHCAAIRTQHALNSVIDLIRLDPKLAQLKLNQALGELRKSKDPLQRLLAQLLPDTLILGRARLRGDSVTMYETIPRIRKWFEGAVRKDDVAKVYYGNYEAILLSDELSLGEIDAVLSTVDLVIDRVRNTDVSHNPQAQAIRANALTALEGIKLRAQESRETNARSNSKTIKEINRDIWLDRDPLFSPLESTLNFLGSRDLKNAAYQLDKAIKAYLNAVENDVIAPNKLLEKQYSLLSQLVFSLENNPGANPLEKNPELVKRLSLNFVTLGQIEHSQDNPVKIRDFRYFSGLRGVSTRVSIFFSKRYLNTIQTTKSEFLKKGYREQSLRVVEIDSGWVRDVAKYFAENNLSRSALDALTIIREQEHSEFLTDKLRSQVLTSQIALDDAEEDFLRVTQRKVTEIRALSIKYLQEESPEKKLIIEGLLHESYNDIEKYIFDFDEKPLVGQIVASLRPSSDASKLQQALGPNDALLIFSVQEQETDLYLYTALEFKTTKVHIGRLELRNLGYELYLSLQSRRSDYRVTTKKFSDLFQSGLAQIFQEFPPDKITRIKVVADDALGIIPPRFYLGPVVGSASPVTLQILSSNYTRDLGVIRKPSFDFFGVVDTGGKYPSLPGVLTEANFLKERVFQKSSGTSRFFLNDFVTRERVIKSLSQESRWVHLATHFDLKADNDKDSGIVLGKGRMLSISELRRTVTGLSGLQLLTLAACETAIGTGSDFSGSKAFNGLATEFVRSGTRFVIASLWKVSDDSSALFMKLLYFFIQSEQLDPPLALHTVQNLFHSGTNSLDKGTLSRIESQLGSDLFSRVQRYSHPFHWAAYVGVSGGGI